MRRLLILPLLAAACAQPPAAPPAGGTCNAAPAQSFVGRTHDEALAEEVRRRTGSRTVRVLRPGQVVTMEYSEQRVNIELDAANRVIAVRCG